MKDEIFRISAFITFCNKYLDQKSISYESEEDDIFTSSGSVHFVENNIEFYYQICDDSIIACAHPTTEIICSDKSIQNKIKEYLQRHNFSSMMTWFYLSINDENELKLYCDANYEYLPENMEFTLLGVTAELTKSINDACDYIKEITNENLQNS